MTKRILAALTTISFVLLAFVSPQLAQERQVGGNASEGTRSPKSCQGENQAVRKPVSAAEAEAIRADLIRLYAESEAMINYLAGYEFIRQSEAMKNYDSVRLELVNHRRQFEQMPIDSVLAHTGIWQDKQLMNRLVKLSQKVRTDVKLRDAIEKSEQYLKSSKQQLDSLSNNAAANSRSARGVIAAPAYIPPTCDFNDPSNYPSGVDLGISNGVSIALHLAVDLTPSEILAACVVAPSPVRIAFAIASGVADQVNNALQAVAVNAVSCEKLRFNIEDKLKDDRGITTVLANVNYYLSFMLKSVRASLSVATSTGVPINCGNARLTEASAFFDGSDNFTGATGQNRLEAYRLLRAAYQNIGAASCVQ